MNDFGFNLTAYVNSQKGTKNESRDSLSNPYRSVVCHYLGFSGPKSLILVLMSSLIK